MQRNSARSVIYAGMLVVVMMLTTIAERVRADEGPAWLIVLQGEVESVSDDRMTIAADPLGVAFTDRPRRMARVVSIPALVDTAWAEGGEFQKDPPNASLVNESTNAIGAITVSKAVWRDGRLEIAFSELESAPPAAGNYIAITLDAIRDMSRARYQRGH